jgi:hypothetical protein
MFFSSYILFQDFKIIHFGFEEESCLINCLLQTGLKEGGCNPLEEKIILFYIGLVLEKKDSFNEGIIFNIFS